MKLLYYMVIYGLAAPGQEYVGTCIGISENNVMVCYYRVVYNLAGKMMMTEWQYITKHDQTVDKNCKFMKNAG